MLTACFARLRGAEFRLSLRPHPRLRYACLGLERGRLFEAVAGASSRHLWLVYNIQSYIKRSNISLGAALTLPTRPLQSDVTFAA